MYFVVDFDLLNNQHPLTKSHPPPWAGEVRVGSSSSRSNKVSLYSDYIWLGSGVIMGLFVIQNRVQEGTIVDSINVKQDQEVINNDKGGELECEYVGHLRNPPPSTASNKLSQIYLLFKVIRTQCGAKWCAPVSKILSSPYPFHTTQYVPCSSPGESFIIPTPTTRQPRWQSIYHRNGVYIWFIRLRKRQGHKRDLCNPLIKYV